jgi:hypothetical protein
MPQAITRLGIVPHGLISWSRRPGVNFGKPPQNSTSVFASFSSVLRSLIGLLTTGLNSISISRRSGIQPAAYRALKGAKLRLHSAWKRRYLTSRGFPHDGNRNVICAPTLSFAHMYSMKEDYAPKSRKLAADGRKFAEDRSCM